MSFYWEKPRYERSNPMAEAVPAGKSGKAINLGPDHVTKWIRIKPKTVIELCAEGKLEKSVVQFIINRGIITRDKLRSALLSGPIRQTLTLAIVNRYAGVVF